MVACEEDNGRHVKPHLARTSDGANKKPDNLKFGAQGIPSSIEVDAGSVARTMGVDSDDEDWLGNAQRRRAKLGVKGCLKKPVVVASPPDRNAARTGGH